MVLFGDSLVAALKTIDRRIAEEEAVLSARLRPMRQERAAIEDAVAAYRRSQRTAQPAKTSARARLRAEAHRIAVQNGGWVESAALVRWALGEGLWGSEESAETAVCGVLRAEPFERARRGAYRLKGVS